MVITMGNEVNDIIAFLQVTVTVLLEIPVSPPVYMIALLSTTFHYKIFCFHDLEWVLWYHHSQFITESFEFQAE